MRSWLKPTHNKYLPTSRKNWPTWASTTDKFPNWTRISKTEFISWFMTMMKSEKLLRLKLQNTRPGYRIIRLNWLQFLYNTKNISDHWPVRFKWHPRLLLEKVKLNRELNLSMMKKKGNSMLLLTKKTSKLHNWLLLYSLSSKCIKINSKLLGQKEMDLGKTLKNFSPTIEVSNKNFNNNYKIRTKNSEI